MSSELKRTKRVVKDVMKTRVRGGRRVRLEEYEKKSVVEGGVTYGELSGEVMDGIIELFSGYKFKFSGKKKTPMAVARFLETIYLTGNISGACKRVGISFATVECWRREDPVFAAAMDEAMERHKDVIEDAIHQRGILGVEKPVYQGGKLVGYTREYSDALLLAKAKAYIPERYGDRISVKTDTSVKVELPKEVADLIAMVSPVIDVTPESKKIENKS